MVCHCMLVLLFVRGIILNFIVFISNFSILNSINLLIPLICAGPLLFYMFSTSIYKSHALLVFHSSFYLNICFLSGFIIFPTPKARVGPLCRQVLHLSLLELPFFSFVVLFSLTRFTLVLCCSCGVGRGLNKVYQVHEDQVDTILAIDISSPLERRKHSIERQPLIDPNHSNHNCYSDEPTY